MNKYGINDNVFLLHGLGRTYRSMHKLAYILSKEGYNTINIDYPSRKLPIDELIEFIHNKIRQNISNDKNIHFVTHSLGGIIVYLLLNKYPIANVSRVVMLAPPAKGSEIVDHLKKFKLFTGFFGPVSTILGADLRHKLENITSNYELGVIAGNKNINILCSYWLKKPHDGIVSVENTKIKGMKDFIVIPATHTFIMSNQQAIKQVLYFLKNGHFNKPLKPLD